jgi:hypothetical protein
MYKLVLGLCISLAPLAARPQIVQQIINTPAPVSGGGCSTPTTSCGTVVMWLDGASLYCTSALCSTNGTSATAWNDLSGNGNNVTLSNNVTDCVFQNSLLNSKPGMVLSGNCNSSSFTSNITWSTSMTVCFVGSTADAADEQGIFDGTTSPQFTYRISSTTHQDIVIPGTADILEGTTTLSINTYYDMCASYNSSTGAASLLLNGSSDGSTTSAHTISNPSTTIFYEPNSSCCVYNGKAMELIVFVPALTSGQLTNLHSNYLSPKYGI